MVDRRADVLVIGAGPAGAAAAWSAARSGAGRVLLVERCDWPRSKVCGSCVNPAGVVVLARMGVMADRELPVAPLSRLRLRTSGDSIALSLDAGVAIERSNLDAALVRAAVLAGAEFRPRTSGKVLARDGARWRVRIADHEVTASVVIACDGLAGSSLALVSEQEQLAVRIDPSSWMGAGAVIPACRAARWHDAVGEGEVAMHLAHAGYVGLVRVPDGRLDIAAALDAAGARAAGGPARAIANVLEACTGVDASALLAEEAIFGAGLLTRRRPRSAAPGLIVAGDAAGYVEPFTGEGIAWALVQGEHAGALGACAAHDPHAWSSLSRDWSRWLASAIDPRRLPCRALRWTIRRPAARRCATAALSRSSLARATAAAFMRRAWRPYSTATAPEAFPCAS